jgi:hypothetical protein
LATEAKKGRAGGTALFCVLAIRQAFCAAPCKIFPSQNRQFAPGKVFPARFRRLYFLINIILISLIYYIFLFWHQHCFKIANNNLKEENHVFGH